MLDAISYLTIYIQNGFSEKEISIGVFLDLKQDYDHVDTYKLYNILLDMEHIVLEFTQREKHG